MQMFDFFAKKFLDLSKIMVCPRGQEEWLRNCGHEGERISFRDFCGRLYMKGL